MMHVTVATQDGTVVFAGVVPEEDVEMKRYTNRPSECSIRMPMRDGLAYLQTKPAEDQEN